MMKDGQAEEAFRELASSVTIQPGQVLAIGGRPDPGLSLGGFLFNQADSQNEKTQQRVLLVWAQAELGGASSKRPAVRSFAGLTATRKTAARKTAAIQAPV